MSKKKTFLNFFVLSFMMNILVINLTPFSALGAESQYPEVPPTMGNEENILCTATGEDLGISSPQMNIYNTGEPYGDISEYVLETEHIIFDENLYEDLITMLSPEVFNNYMYRMDVGYEMMLDLVGREPYNGAKITIKKRFLDSEGVYQWVYGNSPYIYWNTSKIEEIFSDLMAKPDEWWLAGSMHELGHIFDEKEKWEYNAEGSATYKAWLAMIKCNESICWSGVYYTKEEFIEFISSQLNEKVATVFHPIIRQNGFDYGWSILQKVFKSYFDSSYSLTFYKSVKEENSKLVDFIDRCSNFVGNDIKEYWSDAVKRIHEGSINAVSIDKTSIHFVIGPMEPKIGDELTFSVYNVPSQVTETISLKRGNSGNTDFMAHDITLSAGDNKNILSGYTVRALDINNELTFNLNNIGLSDSTSPVKTRGDRDINRMLPRIGDLLDLKGIPEPGETRQWQRSKNKWDWNDISGANSKQYEVSAEDLQYHLRCIVKNADGKMIDITNSTEQAVLFSGDITGAVSGGNPKVNFGFGSKPVELNNYGMNIDVFVDGILRNTVHLKASNLMSGWSWTNAELNDSDIGKEIYAEIYFDGGDIDKIRTPKRIIV